MAQDGAHPALAADHADVGRARTEYFNQAGLIMHVSTGDQYNAGGGANGKPGNCLSVGSDRDLVGVRKAQPVRIARSIVHDGDLEFQYFRHLGQGLSDVTGSDDDEVRRQWAKLEEDVQVSPSNSRRYQIIGSGVVRT